MTRIEIDARTAHVLQAECLGAVVCEDREDGTFAFTADATFEVLAVIREVA